MHPAVQDQIQAQESWRAQCIIDAASVCPATHLPNSIVSDQDLEGTLNAIINLNINFNSHRDLKSFVPINNVIIIAVSIATYKSHKASTMPTIPVETQVRVSTM